MPDGNGKRESAIRDAVRIARTVRALVERGASAALIEHELDRLEVALAALRVAWDRGEGLGEAPGDPSAAPGEG